MEKITEKDSARFDAKVARSLEPNGCWTWMAATSGPEGDKRGDFWHGRKVVRAHRFAYERACGPIPAGLVVRHLCNNPLCVRPAHLAVGTHADNMDDRTAAWRTKKADHPLSLEERGVLLDWANAGRTVAETAKAMGLHKGTVNRGLKLAREERDWAMAVWTLAAVVEARRWSASRPAVTALAA
jgi:HNH endonuclease